MATDREKLQALEDLLRERLDRAPIRETASIAKVLRDVIKDVAALDAQIPQEGSKVDDLAEKRRSRQAKAESS